MRGSDHRQLHQPLSATCRQQRRGGTAALAAEPVQQLQRGKLPGIVQPRLRRADRNHRPQLTNSVAECATRASAPGRRPRSTRSPRCARASRRPSAGLGAPGVLPWPRARPARPGSGPHAASQPSSRSSAWQRHDRSKGRRPYRPQRRRHRKRKGLHSPARLSRRPPAWTAAICLPPSPLAVNPRCRAPVQLPPPPLSCPSSDRPTPPPRRDTLSPS
mmetsp:Transcript_90315/g.235325  ORF Transcript_90315/g.235325 Transcript_90315/m.235325 type:complete len:217 (-) Transcript_90315:202-852(-)